MGEDPRNVKLRSLSYSSDSVADINSVNQDLDVSTTENQDEFQVLKERSPCQ